MSFMFPKEQDNPFISEGLQPGEFRSGFIASTSFEQELTRSSLIGALVRHTEEKVADELDTSAPLDAKTATEKFGIEGELSFSSPVKASVAKVLKRRKEEELQRERILNTASGFGQNAASMGAGFGSAMFDPLTLMASAIPVLGEARWAQLIARWGVTRGRVIGGMIEGGLGNLAMEPALVWQAHQDQMHYGPVDSLSNVGLGALIGGGFGFLAGRWNQHMGAVRQKTHLESLKTAVDQLASGKNVEVESIHRAAAQPENLGKAVNLDTGEGLIDDVPDLGIFESNPAPPYFGMKPGTYHWTDFPGWKQEIVEYNALEMGDHITIHEKGEEDLPVYTEGVVTDVDQAGQVQYEILHDSQEPGFDGSTGLINSTLADDITILKHSGKEEVTSSIPEKKFKPVIEDNSPLLGDPTQDQLETLMNINHQEALNWENLTDSVKVDSDLYPGTHPGAFMRDQATDKVYYTKFPPDAEQARQEYIAWMFYKLADVTVPEVRPIFQDGKLVGIGSQSLENEQWHVPQSQEDLIDSLKTLPKDMRENFYEGVVIDAWLGNRDFSAVGNVIIIDDGPAQGVYRIDYGGSLDYRAQGQKKLGADPGNYEGFGSKVVELDTFIDPDYPQHKVLGPDSSIRYEMLQSGIHRLQNISDDDILSVVYSVGLDQETAQRLSSVLIARRDGILHKFGEYVSPRNDKFVESYTNGHSSKILNSAAKFYTVSPAAEHQLSNYKGVGFDSLNEYLRAQGAGYSQMTHDQMKVAIKNMDEATRGYTFQKTTYLWRSGVPYKAFGLDYDEVGGLPDEVMKKIGGQVFHDKAYMSTSLDKEFTSSWGSPKNLLLRMQVPPGYTGAIPGGKNFKKHGSAMDDEFEYVLPRNTKMLVTGAYQQKLKGKDFTVLNVKVVPHENIKPMTSQQFIEAAKKYHSAPVIGADDEGIPEELLYSLKESTQVDEGDSMVNALNKESEELLTALKQHEGIPEESFAQIAEKHGIMEKQAHGMTKGAYAAYGCVMNNAEL